MPDLKPVLIVESCGTGLQLNEENKVKNKFLMEGVFTEFNTKNRNGRVYTAPKFLPHLNELLERKKTLGVLYGEFDHPDVFDTSLSRVSHVVENAWFDQQNNRINGQIVLLDTHWGKEAKAIVNEGYPVFVSSRAAGITDAAGHVELKKLFTYDCVADPGFASAKMTMKSINESLGIDDKTVGVYEADSKTINRIETQFSKIFDLTDETKTNELFNMNKNENVTKGQLTQYSNYLVGEIKKVKESLTTISADKKSFDPAKLETTVQYYENLNKQFEKVVSYLDYLAEKVQVAVDGHKEVKEITEKLIAHSDHIAENLEKNINYTEYLAENLDKNISYAEYIAENLDKNISYAEYLAENLDKSISYGEYIAESVSDSIKYSEYIAENLDTSIAFQEYLAENVEKGIKYSEYVAECTDNTLSYAGLIAEKLNGGQNSALLNENLSVKSPHEFLQGIMAEVSEEGGEALQQGENEGSVTAEKGGKKKAAFGKEGKEEEEEVKGGEEKKDKPAFLKKDGEGKEEKKEEKDGKKEEEEEVKAKEEKKEEKEEKKEEKKEDKKVEENVEAVADAATATEATTAAAETVAEVAPVAEATEEATEAPAKAGDLTKKIDVLIAEAKKREQSKVQEPHFYKFLNKSQIGAFEVLSNEEQEDIKVAMNESQYFTTQDVLKTMREVLSKRQVSPEETLVAGLPKEVQPVWESLNEGEKNQILAQSKFYVLDSEDKIEHFWRTRKLKAAGALNEGKKLIAEEGLKMNEGLTDEQTNAFMNRFNNLK